MTHDLAIVKFRETRERPITITASHQTRNRSSFEIAEYIPGEKEDRGMNCAKLVGDHASAGTGKKFDAPCTSKAAMMNNPPIAR